MAEGDAKAEKEHLRILYLTDSLAGPTWYRCHTPGMELVKRGHEVALKEEFVQEDIDWCDVLVIQRLWQPEALRAVRYANDRGKLTVFDIDDDYWSMHPSNPAHAFWSEPGRLDDLAMMARACQRVTVPTQPLAERLGTLNRDVRLLPNMLPDEHWPSQPKLVVHEPPIVIGWAGSTSHYPDLRMIEPVLLQLLDIYPQVEVAIAGADREWFRPHERLRFLDHVEIAQYAGLLTGFDIGVAPLEDTRFNAGKSDLKALEYSMIGLPVVASKVPAYSTTIRHGETGLLAKNPKDWLRHLRSLIEDAELRAAMGAAARAWAETRTISRNVGLWEQAYTARSR